MYEGKIINWLVEGRGRCKISGEIAVRFLNLSRQSWNRIFFPAVNSRWCYSYCLSSRKGTVLIVGKGYQTHQIAATARWQEIDYWVFLFVIWKKKGMNRMIWCGSAITVKKHIYSFLQNFSLLSPNSLFPFP